jgi:hypothetical protein
MLFTRNMLKYIFVHIITEFNVQLIPFKSVCGCSILLNLFFLNIFLFKITGRDTLDECGLRYLLAMRLHTCLLTSLPPLYRVQLLHQGMQLPV